MAGLSGMQKNQLVNMPALKKYLRLDRVSFCQISWETIDHVSSNLHNYACVNVYIVSYSEPMIQVLIYLTQFMVQVWHIFFCPWVSKSASFRQDELVVSVFSFLCRMNAPKEMIINYKFLFSSTVAAFVRLNH